MILRHRAGMFIAVALLLTLAALLACGGETDSEGGTDMPVVENGSQSGTGMPVTDAGEMAPNFNIVMFQGQDVVGGEQVDMASLLGEKPVVLNFWAGLCPPCRAEMPDFQRFHEEYGDRVLVLGVDLGQFTNLGAPEQARQLLADVGAEYPAGYTEDAAVISSYRVLGMPSTIFINADGSVASSWTGALNEETLIEKAEEMLGE